MNNSKNDIFEPVPETDKKEIVDKGTQKNNIHKGHRLRTKKKFLKFGLEPFEEHQVLELLLFFCYPQRDTNEIAHKMLDEFGSLNRMLEASADDIMNRCKTSENIATLLTLITAVMKRYESSKWDKMITLDSSKKVGQYAVSLFKGEVNECFYIICLDSQRRLIACELLSKGLVNSAFIYPRQVVEIVVKYNAVSIFITHNHPGGTLDASDKDIKSTAAITNILKPLGVEVIDHIIVGDDDYYSFIERRILQ